MRAKVVRIGFIVVIGAMIGLASRDYLRDERTVAERRLRDCAHFAEQYPKREGLLLALNDNGDWWQMAYLLRAMIAVDRMDLVFPALDAFVAQQNPDGSWCQMAAGRGHEDTRNIADPATMATTLALATPKATGHRWVSYVAALEAWERYTLQNILPDGCYSNGRWRGVKQTAPYTCAVAEMASWHYAMWRLTGDPAHQVIGDNAVTAVALDFYSDGSAQWSEQDGRKTTYSCTGRGVSCAYYAVSDALLWGWYCGSPDAKWWAERSLRFFVAGQNGLLAHWPDEMPRGTTHCAKMPGFLACLSVYVNGMGGEEARGALDKALARAAESWGAFNAESSHGLATTGFYAVAMAEVAEPGSCFGGSQ